MKFMFFSTPAENISALIPMLSATESVVSFDILWFLRCLVILKKFKC